MIVRPHICLRCQLRLAKRSPISRYQFARQHSTAKVIIPRYGRGDESERRYSTKESQDDDKIRFPEVHNRASAARNGPATSHPLGRLYGYLGSLQRANRESLGDINTLGDPAEVIILRDSKIKSYTGGLREIEAIEPESVDILATLDNERGLVGQKEVEENINHLRPKEGEEPETLAGFDELVQELQAGFTVSQLARYIQAFQKDKPEDVLSKFTEGTLIPRISAWVPETSGLRDIGDTDSTLGYSFTSYTSKQRLALRLIRECWKLELPQLEHGIGEVELEFRPGDVDLLLSSSSSVLKSIMNRYITAEGESIQGSTDGNTLFLVTTRAKCRLIVEEIELALANVQKIEKSVRSLIHPSVKQVPQWLDANLSDTVLNTLGDLTNTNISKGNKNTISISCIDQKNNGFISSKADSALRLLVRSVDIPDRTTYWLGCKDVPHSKAGMLLTVLPDDGFSWRDRLRSWSRWTVPVQKKIEEAAPVAENPEDPVSVEKSTIIAVTPTSEQEIPSEKETPIQAAANQSNENESAAYWTSEYFTESSALFGRIIHSMRDESTIQSKLRPADLLKKAHQLFSTKVENISQVLGSSAVRGFRGKPAQSIVLKLIPNPFYLAREPKHPPRPIGAKAMAAFPRVEMRLVVDPETKELQLRDVQAIVSTDNTDLMLPDSSVDIRLQQNIRSRLRGKQGRSPFPPEIVEFINNSNLSLNSASGKLETPPKVMIPIASHLCLGPGFELLGKADSDASMRNVEYLFAGLEICNSVRLEFDGWNLMYTSIEAGKASGRRAELRLRPSRRSIFGEATEEEFMNSALKMAYALDTGKIHNASLGVRRTHHKYKVSRRLESTPRVPIFRGHGKVRDEKTKYFAKRVDFLTEEERRRDEVIDAYWKQLEGEDDH